MAVKNPKLLTVCLMVSVLAATSWKSAWAAEAKPATALATALVETYGGRDYIRSIKGMRLRFSGEIYNPWQSRSTSEASPISTSYRYALDWSGERAVADTDFNFPGGHRIHTLEIKKPAQSLIADMTSHSVVASNKHYRLPAAIRFHPILLMRELIRDDVSLQSSGPVQIEGKTYDVLALQRKAGAPIELLLTQGTIRIGGLRYRSWAADNEGAMATQLFSSDRADGSGPPTIITGFLESSHPQQWRYRLEEATINPAFAADEFDAPAGFSKGIATTSSRVIGLGKGIHLVRGLQNDDYNALVLELKDSLAIFEAPIDREAGMELRRIARQIAPSKPIKYLILSHHHADHIGGASALVEAGTEVIAPAASRPYIEAVLKAGKVTTGYTFRGLERNAKLTIGDGSLQVDVHALRGNAHVDDILFAYVPSEKLVFQADMFFFYEPDYLSYPLNERGFAFYHSLRLLGLDFLRVAGTHGETVTRQRVDALLGYRSAQ